MLSFAKKQEDYYKQEKENRLKENGGRAGVRKKEENGKIIRKFHNCKKAREQLQEKKDFCSKNVGRQYL